MKLVKLTDGVTVNPTCVTRIEIDDYGRGVTVWSDGRGVWVPCDYGQSAYKTKDRLVAEINAALEAGDA